MVSFSNSNFVFYVADDDHQWSVCCHQIPEGLEHTPCAFIILNYLSVKSIYYMPLWIHSMKITLHFLHNIQWNKCVEVTWLFSYMTHHLLVIFEGERIWRKKLIQNTSRKYRVCFLNKHGDYRYFEQGRLALIYYYNVLQHQMCTCSPLMQVM